MVENFQIGPQIREMCINPWQLSDGRVTCKHRGTNRSAVEAEFGGDDLGGFKTGLKGAAFYFVNDRIEYQ